VIFIALCLTTLVRVGGRAVVYTYRRGIGGCPAPRRSCGPRWRLPRSCGRSSDRLRILMRLRLRVLSLNAPGRNRTCLQTGVFPTPVRRRSITGWRELGD